MVIPSEVLQDAMGQMRSSLVVTHSGEHKAILWEIYHYAVLPRAPLEDRSGPLHQAHLDELNAVGMAGNPHFGAHRDVGDTRLGT